MKHILNYYLNEISGSVAVVKFVILLLLFAMAVTYTTKPYSPLNKAYTTECEEIIGRRKRRRSPLNGSCECIDQYIYTNYKKDRLDLRNNTPDKTINMHICERQLISNG